MTWMFVGTSGWAYASWKPKFYPPEVKAAGFLRHYAERFRTVEVNYTFNHLPTTANIEAWTAATPPDFVFALKASQRITHFDRLQHPADTLPVFWEKARPLGERLGPVLFQTPPWLKRNDDLLAGFVAELPSGQRCAMEFRDASRYAPEVYELLSLRNVALCHAEGERAPSPLETAGTTADFRTCGCATSAATTMRLWRPGPTAAARSLRSTRMCTPTSGTTTTARTASRPKSSAPPCNEYCPGQRRATVTGASSTWGGPAMLLKMDRTGVAVLMVLALVVSACATTGAPSGGGGSGAADTGKGFVFASTQFTPVTEQENMRSKILAGYKGAAVDFITEAENASIDRVIAEAKAGGAGQIGLIGYENGQFGTLAKAGYLEDLSKLADKYKGKLPQDMVQLGKAGTSGQVYIPWMQATYIMAVNKKAMEFLPSGADVNALTYDQLIAWGKNIQDKTGQKRIGLPAGANGLFHRLFQGYFYPSYTGGLVTTYKSADAVTMWGKIKELWAVTHPQSTTYNFMQEPLQSEEVWIGMDHVARLIKVLNAKPDQFLAVPAPAGPKGRYYMSVVIGLAIPKTTPNRAGAEALIDHLLKPETQVTTLRENSFFPVLDVPYPADLDKGLKLEAEAVIKQSSAKDAKVVPLPVGLGAKGGDFNKAIIDSFQRIVIKGENVQTVLNEQGALLQKAITEANAPCWGPDGSSTGPCQVK